MSKALTGAVEIAAGALMIVGAAVFDPTLLLNPKFDELAAGVIIGGISAELSSNPAMNLTVRQPAQYRRLIYGTQRVGGATIYTSSSGSSAGQYNVVLVLATHVVWEITALYLDGRQVFFDPNSPNGSTQCPSGAYFGGYGDGNDHWGPDGRKYNFTSKDIFAEARYGQQIPGSYFTSLQANDSTWTPTADGSPDVLDCTVVYVKCGYNATNFTQFPDIKFTIKGKPILDPRTGETTYSSNPSLIIADILEDPDFGLSDSTLNAEQLVAAANICDETVTSATGIVERRYAASYNYDTSAGLGDVITTILATMAARMSRIGGEWFLFPGAFVAPTIGLSDKNVISTPNWKPYRPYRERFNEVRGTYTAPNYPYTPAHVIGDQYDGNGYDGNGQTQNNFQFAFHQTNFPPFAEDPLHGYPSDQYRAADGGRKLTRELPLPACLGITQAQRLAKIELLRNRWEGSGTFTFGLAALQLQPADTFYMTFPARGWVNKLLEVTSVRIRLLSGSGRPPEFQIQVGVQEVDSSIYEWDPAAGDEQTILDTPAVPIQPSYTPTPPTNMTVTSLVVAQPDGTLIHQLQVAWDTPQDPRVTQILVQYQVSTASVWTDGGTVSVNSNAMALNNVVSGLTYNVRIASMLATGAISTWVEADAIATTALSPIVTQGAGVAQSALSLNGTTVTIAPISTTLGSIPVSYYPSGTTVSGVVAGVPNYVYLIDPTTSGGSPQAQVTTSTATFAGKVGYVLLGTVNTAAAAETSVGLPESTAANQVLLSSAADSETYVPTTLTPSLVGADVAGAAAAAQAAAEIFASSAAAQAQAAAIAAAQAAIPQPLSQVPSGTVNGTNAAFAITKAAAVLDVYKNGLMQIPSTDYTLSGTTITFAAASIPQIGDTLYCRGTSA